MSQLNSAYGELQQTFARIGHINAAEQTLHWESRTTMPKGGAATRGTVLATLTGMVAETLHNPRLGDLLDRAEGEEGAGLDPWEAANLREMRRRWHHETAIPAALASRIAKHSAYSQTVWDKARAENDFESFLGPLKETLALVRESAAYKSDAFGVAPYDALLDEYEPGLRMAAIDPVFDDLADFLPGLLARILDHQDRQPAIVPLPGPFPEEQQYQLSHRLARLIGYDYHHGRLDSTVHPFACGVPGDVRITTRFDPEDPITGIMATIHETGHAMYESGLPSDWAFQPVGYARGAAMHESQSLLMEMQAGRSNEFLPVLAQMMREIFGGEGEAWNDENIARLYRKVEADFIRVNADEVTYPLHVILRYRLERAILAGELEAEDIPAAWNELSRDLLGVVPPTHTLGCLQDIHWSAGLIGYFPTYSLGAVMGAQLFAAAKQQDPEILPGLTKGDFSPLLAWTGAKVHSHGSQFPSSNQVVEAATGAPLSTEAFKRHLTSRYLDV